MSFNRFNSTGSLVRVCVVGGRAGEWVLRHVLVPSNSPLDVGQPLSIPLCREGAVDNVDDLDEEGGGSGGGVEDLDEGLVRRDGALFAPLVLRVILSAVLNIFSLYLFTISLKAFSS